MGAVAAAFDKRGRRATSSVVSMFEELKHRGKGQPRVATHPLAFIAQSLGRPNSEKSPSKVAIGTNSSEPVLGERYTAIFEGRFYNPEDFDVSRIMKKMGNQPIETCHRILKEIDGSYVFIVAFPDKVLVGRDTLGIKPLYYGKNESICAVASERKALWRIGISNVHSFPPGNLSTINESGFTFELVATLRLPPQREMGMKEGAECLQRLLEESTQERISDAEKVAVAFSGGLDSSVSAVLAKLAGIPVHLICVGLEGQCEIEKGRNAAEMLGLPLTIETYTVKDVEDALARVLWLIEESNPMKIGVAIPFFWAAQAASRLGYNILLAGQGADELFGGYHRYLTEYSKGGTKAVRKMLYQDTVCSYETNFQRDEPVCAFHGVDLRLPFTDMNVVQFALSLPVALKVKSAEDPLRKGILRQVARNLGLPESISERPKKAIQFTTGVDKALKSLAKKEGLTEESYLRRSFVNAFSNLEVKLP